MLTRKQLVLFDLDGTLVDTAPDLALAIDAMQAGLGLPARGEDRVRQWIGNGMEKLVKRALTGERDGEPEPALFERALRLFMDAYAARPCHRSRFYPGVRQTLEWLRRAGYRLGCITNKRGRFTTALLRMLGIDNHFGLVLCGDTLPQRKPDPLPLLHAAGHFGVAVQQALMVGDSLTDLHAARAAGMQIVCVRYGYHQGADLDAAGPDALIDTMPDLLRLLPEPAAAAV